MDGLINTDQQSKYFQNKKKQCYQFEDTLLKKNSWNWLWVLLKKKKKQKNKSSHYSCRKGTGDISSLVI